MATHVLNLELQLVLRSIAGALQLTSQLLQSCRSGWFIPNLECEMLQKVSCAIGVVRLCPRSSINPDSNCRCLCPWRVLRSNLSLISRYFTELLLFSLTVKPLDRVVVSVLTPFFTTGVANPLLNGATTLRLARPRSPLLRFKASRRDAMWVVSKSRLGSISWN